MTIEQIFDGHGGWEAFWDRFGQRGYAFFGEIAFDADRSTARVELGQVAGPSIDIGCMFTLERTGSEWRVTNVENTWIS